MYVFAFAEGLEQHAILREVGQNAELNLRVIGCQQHASLAGDKRGTNLHSQFGADGDILQIRIAAGEPSRGGHRLVKRSVDPAGFRVYQSRQRIHVA